MKRYLLINLLLLIIAGILGFKFYRVLAYPLDISLEPEAKEKQAEEKVIRPAGKVPDEETFQIIVLKDIFQPSRSPAMPKITKKVVPVQNLPRKPPRLFGTLIMNGEKAAIFEDPVTRVTKRYRINESIAGFTVKEIQKDRVMLSDNGRIIEVRLREKKGIKPQPVIKPPQKQKPGSTPPLPEKKAGF